MWHVVLLIVSETCVEWRNLGGFRSRVRCPCPQLAAAQWWEAAGRGISCSNYVRCIATLCDSINAMHTINHSSSELSTNFQFWSAFHLTYYNNVDSCVFFWDITILQTCVQWRASEVHWYWLPNKVWTVTVELIDIIFAAIPSTFPYLHYNWYFISCCYWPNIGCWWLVTRWPGPAGVWRPLMSAWRTCHGD